LHEINSNYSVEFWPVHVHEKLLNIDKNNLMLCHVTMWRHSCRCWCCWAVIRGMDSKPAGVSSLNPSMQLPPLIARFTTGTW